MPEPLTPLQTYYVDAIHLALYVGGFVAVIGVFLLGFIAVRGFASWK
ncbi:MAG: hypothetical protein Q7T59_06235 [Candidatus Woesebacteria bacterium]|nr:hypothetical protein [Candidatus Woesebacteria bacterium]